MNKKKLRKRSWVFDRNRIAKKYMINVGYLYHQGLGVEQNAEEAAEYFRKTYESGEPQVIALLDNLVKQGILTEEDFKPAAAE